MMSKSNRDISIQGFGTIFLALEIIVYLQVLGCSYQHPPDQKMETWNPWLYVLWNGGSASLGRYEVDGTPEQARQAVPVLISAIGQENPKVAERAVSLLCQILGGDAAIPALSEALRNEKTRLDYHEIVGALAHFRADANEVIPILIGLLHDQDHDMRAGAGWALRGYGPDARAAVPALIQVLKDPEWSVRQAAACALGQVGPDSRDGIPLLMEMTKDTNPNLSEPASEAILRISGRGERK